MNVTDLFENKLARVWSMARNRRFAIMTAFRSEYDREKNLRRNAALSANVRAFGAGFWILDGHWVENPGTEEETNIREDSLFISLSATSTRDLRGFIIQQMKEWGQEAAVLKNQPDEEVLILSADGSEFPVGQFSPNKAAQAYSRIRGSGRTFVFESARAAGGWAAHLLSARRNVS